MSKSSVGLIGAGLLGQSIAHCLLQSHEAVIGFDIENVILYFLCEQSITVKHKTINTHKYDFVEERDCRSPRVWSWLGNT